jgi:hypothetical protein
MCMTQESVAQTDVNRLKELASKHLFVKTDTKSHIKDIPAELIEGCYRWKVYIYSNLFELKKDEISISDKIMFIRLSKKFLIQHMNPWSRSKLYVFNLSKYFKLRNQILQKIYSTNSFHELRICLYLLASFKNGLFCYDDYMLELCPWLNDYN